MVLRMLASATAGLTIQVQSARYTQRTAILHTRLQATTRTKSRTQEFSALGITAGEAMESAGIMSWVKARLDLRQPWLKDHFQL